MSLNDEERKTLVDLYWKKSESTIKEAEIAVANEAWDMAANRIYYACFHAMTALLVNDGHPVSTHLGMKISFGKYYVQTGVATPQQGRLFSQLASLREKADYDCLFTTTQEDVMQYLPEAKMLIKRIKTLLQDN
jgi:hypothetical protein